LTNDDTFPSDSAPEHPDTPAADKPGVNTEPPLPILLQEAEPAPPPAPPEPYAHLPEDLRVPWTWMDLLISFLFVVALFLVTIPVLWSAMEVWQQVRPVEGKDLQTRIAILGVLHTVALFVMVLLYLILFVRQRYSKPFWRTIGYRAFRIGEMGPGWSGVVLVFLGMALSVMVASLAGFVDIKEPVPVQRLFEARESALLFLLAAVFVAPLVEETLFRGWLYPVIARTFGVVAGVVVTGGLFGLMHGAQLGGHWELIALLTLVGIVLTWVRARTGSTLSSYFLHLGYNTLIAVGFLVGTSGLRNLPPAQ